ncbi:hypothetical protein FDP41_009801 [Naegleria fowleri]|uniref:Deacetylase sirtuin-type domain-containing protein n=1 Tax=Naegleria fowleri TaxID=5763 RepID=A0A6A5BDC2_NAEFO|nr:uncharacterized protein FDP41_009801 [Naegleria fowleri]KAF0972105.1 hypothetical protein FDP41_009801 [Naegleria fowleri]
MSKALAKFKRNKKADPYEKAAESIFLSYFILVVVGEEFSSTSGNKLLQDIFEKRAKAYADAGLSFDDLCSPMLLSKGQDELFYGFWGQVLNRSQKSKSSGAATATKIIHHWKELFFQMNDPRFQPDDKNKKKQTEEPSPEEKKKLLSQPSRFFIVTSNIDAEFVKEGFKENELYETRGNVLTWQCATPCCKNTFSAREDFRFEINQESGRAPPLKYSDKSHQKKNISDFDSSTLQPTTTEFATLGEEDFDFYSATGKTDYFRSRLYMDKPGFSMGNNGMQEKLLPSQIGEKRGAYYQFFAPKDVPDKFKNPENYLRPGSAKRISYVYGKNNYVLGSLVEIGKMAEQAYTNGAGIQSGLTSRSLIERRDAVLQRYNLIYDESDEEEIPKSAKNNVHKTNSLKLVIENKSGQETKLEQFSEDIHTTLHDFAFSGEIEPTEEGFMEVTIIDPMIHYHQFYTDLHNTDEIVTEKDVLEFRKNPLPIIPRDQTLVAGSANVTYIISIQIINLDDELSEEPALSYTSKVCPTIRRKREEDGIFVDSVIINVNDAIANIGGSSNIGAEKHVLPTRGKVSVVVQPSKPKEKRKSSVPSLPKVIRVEEQPWQLVGEYNMRFLLETPPSYSASKQASNMGSNGNSQLFKVGSKTQTPLVNVRMLDISLKTRDSVHSLKLRAIQGGEGRSVELATLFVDMPITDFSTANPVPQLSQDKKPPNTTTTTASTSSPNTATFTPNTAFSQQQSPNTFNTPKSSVFTENIDFSSRKTQPHQVSDLLSGRVKSAEDIDLYNPRKQPIINRIFCETCRGVARPRVKMNLTDDKWIKTSIMPYKTWSTKVKKAIQEEGRSIVVLEVGAEAKLRAITDMILKQNSDSAEIIRINPKLRVVRGQKEVLKIPSGAEGQYNVIEDPSSSAAIKKIDQYLTEISERFSSRV